MNILITGATGFLGQHLVQKLLAEGHELLLLSRNKNAESLPQTKWLNAELKSIEKILPQIEKFAPEAIYHLAWEGIPDFSEPMCRENLVNSLNFLAPILALPSVTNLTVSGSCWEYGDVHGHCQEKAESSPHNWFTWTNHTLRSYLERICSETDVNLYWMRIFFVYGPGQRTSALIPTAISSLQQNQQPDIRSPYACNDFIYVEDVVSGLAQTLIKDMPAGIYNLGSGSETPVIDVVKCIEQGLFGNTKFASAIETNHPNKGPSPSSIYADLTKSNSVLGWQPITNLADGILKTLSSIQS